MSPPGYIILDFQLYCCFFFFFLMGSTLLLVPSIIASFKIKRKNQFTIGSSLQNV